MTVMRTGFAVIFGALTLLLPASGACGGEQGCGAAPDLGQPVAFPGAVMVSPNLTYAQIDGFRPLTLDLYQIPSKPKETPRPAILFVHGGAMARGRCPPRRWL